jgi:hypothetical protein
MSLGTEIKPPKDAAAFEARVLDLWARTRLPLTRANVIAATGAPRAKADLWLDAMVKGDLLELDSDDDGEMLWVVRGTKRPARGLETLDEVRRMQAASHDAEIVVSRRGGALATRSPSAALARGGDKKSVVASGLLSFFLGPLGLLYAAPLKVALPAVLAWVVACSLIPKFILVYLLGAISPVCAILGVLYAIGYNVAGERVTLFGRDGKEPKQLR